MEAVARMRCSKGLTVERYLGSFHRRTPTDIDLPAVNTDQSIAVQLRHEDKLDKEAFLQFVVLYSTTQGERRIRQALLPSLMECRILHASHANRRAETAYSLKLYTMPYCTSQHVRNNRLQSNTSNFLLFVHFNYSCDPDDST